MVSAPSSSCLGSPFLQSWTVTYKPSQSLPTPCKLLLVSVLSQQQKASQGNGAQSTFACCLRLLFISVCQVVSYSHFIEVHIKAIRSEVITQFPIALKW